MKLMGDSGVMDADEKKALVDKVWYLSARDVLLREDMVRILEICRDATDRKIADVSERIKPDGTMQ